MFEFLCGQICRVYREPCGTGDVPEHVACRAAHVEACLNAADPSADDRTQRASINATECTPPSACLVDGVCPDGRCMCQPRSVIQPCDWQRWPALLGSAGYTLPSRLPVDVRVFPFQCAPGILGSASPENQSSPACAGGCPSGKFCPTEATLVPQDCEPGSFCPESSVTPTPCPPGTWSDATNLRSATDCSLCPAGSSCVAGSTRPVACSPGTFSSDVGQSACVRCERGKFQRRYQQSACTFCDPGSFCRAGSAEPVNCPSGSFGNATGLHSEAQCVPAPVGHWAPLGSRSPVSCDGLSGFYCPGALRDYVHRGAKPVVMPIGHTTGRVEVSALTKDMAVNISMDSFVAQRDGLLQLLASLYAVSPRTLTLEVLPGSLTMPGRRRRRTQATQDTSSIWLPHGEDATAWFLRVTFATADGSLAEVDMDALEEAVAAVDDATIGAFIGVATATSFITVVSEPPQRRSLELELLSPCPAGAWCTAGRQVACGRNTYNPLPGTDDGTACIACPPNSHTLGTASAHREQCVCDTGYYDGNASMAVDVDLQRLTSAAGNPSTVLGAAVECFACPPGVQCVGGSTLENLPLRVGYFRLDVTTDDVRRCPDASANCSGASECPASSTGCIGGDDPAACAPGLRGVYCQLCNESDAFYVAASDDATAHCKPCARVMSDPQMQAFVAVMSTLVTLAVCSLFIRALPVLRRQGEPSTLWFTRWVSALERFTLLNKLKQLWAFYQIATRVDVVYEIYLPTDVRTLLRPLLVVLSLGIDGFPLECVGLVGYISHLRFWLFSPLALAALFVAAATVRTCFDRASIRISSLMVQIAVYALPYVLRLAFVVYPIGALIPRFQPKVNAYPWTLFTGSDGCASHARSHQLGLRGLLLL